MRLLAKKIVVCMLGVASVHKMELALINKFKGYHEGRLENNEPIKRFFPKNFTFEDVERVIGKIIERYKTLCPNLGIILFKEDLATNKLQGVEARIATKIMLEFTRQSKPILCIHDSFRVLEEDEDLLRKLMKESYLAEVGMPPLGLKTDRQPLLPFDDIDSHHIQAKLEYVAYTDASGDEYGSIGCVQDVDGVEYAYKGMRYRFSAEKNQDYVLDDSGLGLGWIAQGTRTNYDSYIGGVQ